MSTRYSCWLMLSTTTDGAAEAATSPAWAVDRGVGFRAAGTSQGKYQATPFEAWHLSSRQPARRHHLRLVSHVAQTPTIEDWQGELQELWNESEEDLEPAREATLAWWAEFWNRSWIVIDPERPDPESRPWRAARNYTLFRYQLGGNAFGEYPTKFNGGNLVFDPCLVQESRPYPPDWRDWGGGVFTAQNQRLVYWPMLKARDFDAVLPQLELYRKGLPGARARVQEHFGHDGALYSEYASVPGIALGNAWGWKEGDRVFQPAESWKRYQNVECPQFYPLFPQPLRSDRP